LLTRPFVGRLRRAHAGAGMRAVAAPGRCITTWITSRMVAAGLRHGARYPACIPGRVIISRETKRRIGHSAPATMAAELHCSAGLWRAAAPDGWLPRASVVNSCGYHRVCRGLRCWPGRMHRRHGGCLRRPPTGMEVLQEEPRRSRSKVCASASASAAARGRHRQGRHRPAGRCCRPSGPQRWGRWRSASS
jgi:hypothetical protein